MIQLLLDRDANLLTLRGRYNETPLLYAARFAPLEIVKLLLDNGADADEKDDEGYTPLDIARQCSDREEVVQFLEHYTGRG